MTEGLFTDEELVGRYQSDTIRGRAHLDELFRRYHGRVSDWCVRLTHDRESAPDMAQEVLFKAFRSLSSYQGASKFSTWLYSIARNHCLSAIRSKQLRPPPDGEEMLPVLADGQPGPEGLMERAESSRLLQALIETSLDEREKEVMALYYGEELPLEAITRMMGLGNASGAKAYIVSAKRKLERAVRGLGMRAAGAGWRQARGF